MNNILKYIVYCTRTTTKLLSEFKDADKKTMVHIVFNSSYIYFNSDKVTDKKSGKVCFGVEFIREKSYFNGQYICLLQLHWRDEYPLHLQLNLFNIYGRV